jgi:hypothetical protein
MLDGVIIIIKLQMDEFEREREEKRAEEKKESVDGE